MQGDCWKGWPSPPCKFRNIKDKCFFNKRTVNVLVSCSCQCPGISAPSPAYLIVSLILCSTESNVQEGESRTLCGRRVCPNSPSRSKKETRELLEGTKDPIVPIDWPSRQINDFCMSGLLIFNCLHPLG